MRWLSLSALEEFLDIWFNIGQIQSKIKQDPNQIMNFCHNSTTVYVEYELNSTNIWKEAECRPKSMLVIFASSYINNIYYPTNSGIQQTVTNLNIFIIVHTKLS
jgi:hypothetical protein